MSNNFLSKLGFGSLFRNKEQEITTPSVKANFTFNPDKEIKEDTLVSFINTSENAQDFVWDFGDGSISTDPNPKHKYRSSGEYKVKLIALNEQETDSNKKNLLVEL